MTNPGQINGDHNLFIAGNDAQAKGTVTEIAGSLGWTHVQDMGDIKASRAIETIVLVWLQLMVTSGRALHNLHVARG